MFTDFNNKRQESIFLLKNLTDFFAKQETRPAFVASRFAGILKCSNIKISGMIMNRANFKFSFAFFACKMQLLIVVAVFCTAQFATANSKKLQQAIVDNDSAEVSGEHLLYSKVIDSYRSKTLGDLSRAVELMQKAYPRSVHTDNALYLKAELTLEKGQYQISLDTIETLLSAYPTSNKRVSALYLKSQALNQTKQVKAAELAQTEVQTRYPGSIEAAKIYSQRTLQQ